MNHSLWVEKYRPVDLSTYIGNEHLKDKVGKYLETGDVPHLWLHDTKCTGILEKSDGNIFKTL